MSEQREHEFDAAWRCRYCAKPFIDAAGTACLGAPIPVNDGVGERQQAMPNPPQWKDAADNAFSDALHAIHAKPSNKPAQSVPSIGHALRQVNRPTELVGLANRFMAGRGE